MKGQLTVELAVGRKAVRAAEARARREARKAATAARKAEAKAAAWRARVAGVVWDGSGWLVPSKSSPTGWARVSLDERNVMQCDCRGFTFRKTCVHIDAALENQAQRVAVGWPF